MKTEYRPGFACEYAGDQKMTCHWQSAKLDEALEHAKLAGHSVVIAMLEWDWRTEKFGHVQEWSE